MMPGELTIAHVGHVVEVLALNGGQTRNERPLWVEAKVAGITGGGEVIVRLSAETLQLVNAKRKPTRPKVEARLTVPVGLVRWPQGSQAGEGREVDHREETPDDRGPGLFGGMP